MVDPMKQEVREEQEVFSELVALCASPGYVHVIAYFCHRENTIKYADQISAEDLLPQYSMERLIRTEISTLIGLTCKNEIDTGQPSPDTMQNYINTTETLLNELHHSMMRPMMQSIGLNTSPDKDMKTGQVFREPIFYGGEAAYNFQYRDLSLIKYQKDNDWFQKKKGFSVQQACTVVSAIGKYQIDKLNILVKGLAGKDPNDWTVLPAYIFTIDEIANEAAVCSSIVKSVIESFVTPDDVDMNDFSALDDFNPKNAYPILRLSDDNFLLFQSYSLTEALYETPFFWFTADQEYKNIAMDHRGEFTEHFSAERLKLVFGNNRVFANIEIYDSKKTRVGEIDVLVVFANRAIILQAKSKKLTIAARKGNDNCLKDDFKKAIQDAYNQGFLCAELLQNKDLKFIGTEGNELNIPRDYKEIYPFCVVSDHYPALAFQAREFLQYQETEIIKPPFVMDVFLLDVMTEMLQSPLYFLSYINRRSQYLKNVLSTHELTILSFHLKYNLNFDDEYSLVQLGDDIAVDLDIAMFTRRDNVPGLDTPEGVLTRYKNTTFGQIIRDIDKLDDPNTIDLGFLLLELSGDTIEKINDGVAKIVESTKRDGKLHDITLSIGEAKTGITIHCNDAPPSMSASILENHCHLRKYKLKAKTWFGICVDPKNARINFGLNLDFDWEQSDAMDKEVKYLKRPQHLKPEQTINFGTQIRPGRKIGVNDKCPCGSGKKYKKCCKP